MWTGGLCRIDTARLPQGTGRPAHRRQLGPDHEVQPGCTQVGAMVGRTLGIGLNSIQKRPTRGCHRVRSMAPAGGRSGVQPEPSWVRCCVLGSQLSLGHGCGSTAARDWARQGGANRRRPRACRPWVHGVRSTPSPAGVPESARKNACLWRTGGQPGRCGTQREQLGKPSEDTSSLEKTSGTAAVRTGAAGQRIQPPCGTSRRIRR